MRTTYKPYAITPLPIIAADIRLAVESLTNTASRAETGEWIDTAPAGLNHAFTVNGSRIVT